MSAIELLSGITRVSFVVIGLLAIADFLRHRDLKRRDIALVFSSLAVPVALPMLTTALRIQARWLNIVGAFVLIAQPYLLLRLVGYFRTIPTVMKYIALGGMLFSWAALVVFGTALPTIVTVAVIGYFICVNGYAMLAFVQDALASSGVIRQRLRFAAAGSGLVAGTLFIAGVGNVLPPSIRAITSVLTQLLGMLAAFTYYIGFLPPRWLRRTWQLSELRTFLLQAMHQSRTRHLSTSETLNESCQAAKQAVGGTVAVIAFQDETHQRWILRNTADCPALSGVFFDGNGVAAKARDGKPEALTRASSTPYSVFIPLLDSVGANTLFVVPVTTGERIWGLLLVFLLHYSLFEEDDLDLLALLAQESALVLQNTALVEDLQNYNQQLRQATRQLSTTNKELEAFSYSVSHDLRAPLRALDGFSRILVEDYADNLDETGMSYLQRIRGASQRMGQLIDDLLQLSRLTRTELRLQDVDLSALVREIAAELQERNPQRQVEFVIADNLNVHGDAQLLRAMLINLLDNALKFTGKNPQPRIEFGITDRNGKPTYFVRDNGAGFDMAYAGKLFGAFQRLHSNHEFEGTGVGLATVQRVVHRHGGEIAAEGAVDQGATFYFTL